MRKLSAAFLIFFGLASAALAQTRFTQPPPAGVMIGGYQVVDTCGSASLTAGWTVLGVMDTTGAICTNAASSGGTTAVTIADGADIAEGTVAATASTVGGAGSVSAKLRLITTQLAAINTTLGTPFQAGAALAANQSVNVTQIAGSTAATGSGAMTAGTQRVALATDSPGILTPGPAAIASSVPTIPSSQYPANAVGAATPITGNATGSTGAVVGTLAATGTKTTYICGFNVSATGGVATIGPITVAGLVGSSMVFQLFSTATGANLSQSFTPCVPASAINTAITITTTADGTATAVDVNSWGYQL